MVVFRYEPLAYMLKHGLAALSYEAWGILEKEFKNVGYSPNWKKYQAMEDSNDLRFIAMRNGSELVGYAAVEIYEDAHRSSIKTAYITDIYVTTKYRGYASKLVEFIEEQATHLGVNNLTIAERFNFEQDRGGVGRFYEFMGFSPQECLWVKPLSEIRVQ